MPGMSRWLCECKLDQIYSDSYIVTFNFYITIVNYNITFHTTLLDGVTRVTMIGVLKLTEMHYVIYQM